MELQLQRQKDKKQERASDPSIVIVGTPKDAVQKVDERRQLVFSTLSD